MPVRSQRSTPVKAAVGKRVAVVKDRDFDFVKATAKRFFHRSFMGRTVGRIEEKAILNNFLGSDDPQTALYIAGHPGTGKTAVISELLSGRDENSHLMINCIMKGSVKTVLKEIYAHFNVGDLSELHDVCLVLDEVDHLAGQDLDLVKRMYSLKDIKLIGIANTLDLAINHLPSAKPVSFPPYTVDDISAILSSRLLLANGACNASVIEPVAVELVARKCAAVGDLRKALEIIQSAIDSVHDVERANHALVNLPIVMKTIERVMPVIANEASRLSRLLSQANLHQKMIIAGIISIRQASFEARPTLQSVFEEYNKIKDVLRIGGDSVSRADFLDSCSNLESIGLAKLHAQGKPFDRWSVKMSIIGDPAEMHSTLCTGNSLFTCLFT